MLDESVVRPFDDAFLDLFSLVEGDLFGVLDEAGVSESKFSCEKETQRGKLGGGEERREEKNGRSSWEWG